MPRQLALYVACSLDGYIAGPGGDMSFLNGPMQSGEDYDYAAFMQTVDTVLVGRKTYDWVMTQVKVFPHINKECYVITHTPRPAAGDLTFYTGDVVTLVNELKSRAGKNIFCDGGAELIHSLLYAGQVDTLRLFIVPVLLGGGTRLFSDGRPPAGLKLLKSKSYPSGMLELHYACIN